MSDEAIERVQYGDGPRARTGPEPNVDVAGHWHFPNPATTSISNLGDIAGGWHFPGPDVSAKDESTGPIRIVPLKQGFVVSLGDFEDDDLAFTDAFDLADWLLDWLGVGLECDPDRCSDAHDLLDDDAEQQRAEYNEWVEDALAVAEAAQAYFESDPGFGPIDQDEYRLFNKLAKAVKKWRGMGREEVAEGGATDEPDYIPYAARVFY